MRWIKKTGRRTRTFFALFPVRLRGLRGDAVETRWMEFVSVEQEYDNWEGWVSFRFVDEAGK